LIFFIYAFLGFCVAGAIACYYWEGKRITDKQEEDDDDE
jgi:hypothetical protein